MTLYLLILNLILIVCNAQEHHSCLKSHTVLTSQPSISTCIQQGPPGKRGPTGLKGDAGSKGDKGESGNLNQSSINALRGKFHIIACLLSLYKKILHKIIICS